MFALLSIFLFLGNTLGLCADNGIFGAPNIESYQALTPEQHESFRMQYPKLRAADFVRSSETSYKSSSIYVGQGREDLDAITSKLLRLAPMYKRILFIGRSLSGAMAYLEGILHAGKIKTPEISDLPFSCRIPSKITREQRLGLRAHLKANQLSPQDILNSAAPILLADVVFNATGVMALLEEIHKWAEEENVPKIAIQEKLSFFGAYPAEMIARHNLQRLEHDMRRELGPRYKPYTEDDVLSEIQKTFLPRDYEIRDYVKDVYSLKISTEFYNYAATHLEPPQRSFITAEWNKLFDRKQKLQFVDHLQDSRFIELHFLIEEGKKNSALCPSFLH